MTPSLSLAARLRVLAAPHRTDRLKVLKQEAVPFGFWLRAAQALKMPPNAMSRSMTHRYQHKEESVPGFPDRLEVCLSVDGHGGFQARAWHDGKTTDFEGSSPYRPWVPTKLSHWPPRAQTRPAPNEKGIGSDRDSDAARSDILNKLAKLLRSAFKAPAPIDSQVSYHSPVIDKYHYRGRECVLLGPTYERYWPGEYRWDLAKHRVNPDVPALWEELTAPLRSAWADFAEELITTLQGTWEIISYSGERHGIKDATFSWHPQLVVLPNPVLLQDEPEAILNSLTLLERELPRMVRPFQTAALQTRAEDMGTDVETQRFLHAYVASAIKNGPSQRRLTFTKVQVSETETDAELKFPELQSPELIAARRLEQGYEYLPNNEWHEWLKEWDSTWEDLLPKGWGAPHFSISSGRSVLEPELRLSIPHGADVPLSLARRAGKLAGSQFKDYFRLLEAAYEDYKEHKVMGEGFLDSEDREDEEA